MAIDSTPYEYLIISGSLRSGSWSRVLAMTLAEQYKGLGAAFQFVDLRDYPIPLCDGEAAYGDPNVGKLSSIIEPARVIIVATPIYNYDANAALKNLMEMTGSAWENKIVGFLCAAGGAMSYMSIMSFANSLMLDFRCLIIPRFVYAQKSDFTAETHPTPELTKRIHELAESSMKIRNG